MRAGLRLLKHIEHLNRHKKTAPKGGFTFTEEGINPVAWVEFCSLCQTM